MKLLINSNFHSMSYQSKIYFLIFILLSFPIFAFAETGNDISNGSTTQTGVIAPQYVKMCKESYQII